MWASIYILVVEADCWKGLAGSLVRCGGLEVALFRRVDVIIQLILV